MWFVRKLFKLAAERQFDDFSKLTKPFHISRIYICIKHVLTAAPYQ